MIVADLFNIMDTLDNEIDLSAGGSDEARAIAALNIAQRHCYKVAAGIKGVMSTFGKNAIKTDAGQEWTNKPPDLLREDSLWALSQDALLRPIYELRRIDDTGGHMPTLPWPLSWAVSSTNGQPFAYYEDAGQWFWSPVPALIYQMRAYGLWAPADFKDRDSGVTWPGNAAYHLCDAVAAYALKYMTMAVDDPTDNLQALALEMFAPALKALSQRDRSKGKSRRYEYTHST